MYNQALRSFTMEDASGSYSWMVENYDPADYQAMTDEELTEWVDGLIATAKENAGYELDRTIETLTFPRMGYTTADRFEDADQYRTFKLAEIDSDLDAERPHVAQFLKNWIAGK